MENNIVLYGASGHCKVIIDILQESNNFIKAIIADYFEHEFILNLPISKTNEHQFDVNNKYIIAIGNNIARKEISNKLKVSFFKAIHPKSVISKFSKIGDGTVVMAGVVINPDVQIGKHCIINTSASVDHDCFIEDFVHISPNASLAGGVFVGEGTHIGIGAKVIQNITIGKWSVIGAGAIIIKDVPDFSVVVGNPGRIIKKNNNE